MATYLKLVDLVEVQLELAHEVTCVGHRHIHQHVAVCNARKGM